MGPRYSAPITDDGLPAPFRTAILNRIGVEENEAERTRQKKRLAKGPDETPEDEIIKKKEEE